MIVIHVGTKKRREQSAHVDRMWISIYKSII